MLSGLNETDPVNRAAAQTAAALPRSTLFTNSGTGSQAGVGEGVGEVEGVGVVVGTGVGVEDGIGMDDETGTPAMVPARIGMEVVVVSQMPPPDIWLMSGVMNV